MTFSFASTYVKRKLAFQTAFCLAYYIGKIMTQTLYQGDKINPTLSQKTPDFKNLKALQCNPIAKFFEIKNKEVVF